MTEEEKDFDGRWRPIQAKLQAEALTDYQFQQVQKLLQACQRIHGALALILLLVLLTDFGLLVWLGLHLFKK